MSTLLASGVPNPLETLPVWFQLTAMTVNTMFGAALARSRNLPIFGTVFAGLLVGFGGGIVRDMLLGLEPVAISNPYFLPVGVVGAVIGALLFSKIVTADKFGVMLHGAVLGLLVTIGAQKALSYDAPVFSAMALGVITASFGGMLADVMSGQRATIAKQAHWVASALVVGSTLFVLISLTTNFWFATVAAMVAVSALLYVSQHRDWPSPHWPRESLSTP